MPTMWIPAGMLDRCCSSATQLHAAGACSATKAAAACGDNAPRRACRRKERRRTWLCRRLPFPVRTDIAAQRSSARRRRGSAATPSREKPTAV